MQHRNGVVVAFEQVRNTVGAVLGAAEDDDGLVIHPLQNLAQQIALLVLGHRIDDVLDGVSHGAARADLNGLRRPHRPFDGRFNLWRNRR